jgi:hypothetical protein
MKENAEAPQGQKIDDEKPGHTPQPARVTAARQRARSGQRSAAKEAGAAGQGGDGPADGDGEQAAVGPAGAGDGDAAEGGAAQSDDQDPGEKGRPGVHDGDGAGGPDDALNEALESLMQKVQVSREQAELRELASAESERKEGERQRKEGERREGEIKRQTRLSEGEARSQWARFAEGRAYLTGGVAAALGFSVLTAVILLFGAKMQVPPETRWIVAVSSGVVAWLFLVGALVLPTLRQARREQREVEALARETVAESADELDDAKDLVALIKANRRQMSAYDVLAQAQANTAFRNSQLAMAAGLIVLVGGAIVAIAAPELATKVATASLTAIGGALSGFIARTFLQTYSNAIRQLNFYFQQPLITSYLLTAQRLISELSDGQARDAALNGVINRINEELVRPWDVDADSEPKRKPAPRKSKERKPAAVAK